MLLLIGYGNELRRDDGVGPRIARAVAEWDIPGVCALAVHQLTPELADDIARAKEVVFVDAASNSDTTGVSFQPMQAAESSSLANHACSLPALLGLVEVLYSRRPVARLLTVPARDLDFGDGLSQETEEDAARALHTIRLWINQGWAHA